jgi:hypothetical protein
MAKVRDPKTGDEWEIVGGVDEASNAIVQNDKGQNKVMTVIYLSDKNGNPILD